MRGGLMWAEGADCSPAISISLTSEGAAIQVRFIASAMSSLTRLTTNSPVSRMFRAVSFHPFSGSARTPTASVGGVWPIALKKL